MLRNASDRGEFAVCQPRPARMAIKGGLSRVAGRKLGCATLAFCHFLPHQNPSSMGLPFSVFCCVFKGIGCTFLSGCIQPSGRAGEFSASVEKGIPTFQFLESLVQAGNMFLP